MEDAEGRTFSQDLPDVQSVPNEELEEGEIVDGVEDPITSTPKSRPAARRSLHTESRSGGLFPPRQPSAAATNVSSHERQHFAGVTGGSPVGPQDPSAESVIESSKYLQSQFPADESFNLRLYNAENAIRRFFQDPLLDLASGLQHDLSSRCTVRDAQDLVVLAADVLCSARNKYQSVHPGLISSAKRVQQFLEGLQCAAERSVVSTDWRTLHAALVRIDTELQTRLREFHADDSPAHTRGALGASQSHTTEPNNRLYKTILNSVTVFDGENFDGWLSKFKTAIASLGISLQETKMLLMAKLSEKYQVKIRETQHMTSWDQIRNSLREDFSSAPTDVEAILQWQQLAQEDKTMVDYCAEVTELLAQTSGQTDTMDSLKITSFLRGLNDGGLRKSLFKAFLEPKNKGRVSLQNLITKAKTSAKINNLAQPVTPKSALASQSDSRKRGASGSGHAPSKNPRPTPSGSNATGNSQGGRTPSSGSNQNSNNDGKWCYRHRARSHNTAECKTPAGVCPFCQQNVGEEVLQGTEHITQCTAEKCRKCGRRGHRAENCRRPPRNQQQQQQQGGNQWQRQQNGQRRANHADQTQNQDGNHDQSA